MPSPRQSDALGVAHEVVGVVPLLEDLEAFVIFPAIVGGRRILKGKVRIVRIVASDARWREVIANPADGGL
jgi:hypothetical protein